MAGAICSQIELQAFPRPVKVPHGDLEPVRTPPGCGLGVGSDECFQEALPSDVV